MDENSTFDAPELGIETTANMDKDGWFNSPNTEIPKRGLMKPWGYKVLVMPVRAPTISKGGIFIPITVQEAQGYLNYFGRVAALGRGAFKAKRFADLGMTAKDHPQVGDWVFYPVYQYLRLKMGRTAKQGGDIRFVMMNDDQILGTAPKGCDPWKWKVEK